MKANKSHSQAWNDIIFENRNKQYGAYQLRELYTRNVLKAFLLAVIVMLCILFLPKMLRLLEEEQEILVLPARTIQYTELAPPPPIETTPPPPANTPPPAKKVVKYLPPKVTEEEVPEEEPMPTVEEIRHVETGLENTEGTADVVMDLPIAGTGDAPAPAEETVYQFAEQMPEFEGGTEAMVKYLLKNLRYPASARRMGIEGSVFVKFVIGTDGKVENVEILKGISKDCDEEAARVISNMPAWKPGKQNSRTVKVSMILPIKFKLA